MAGRGELLTFFFSASPVKVECDAAISMRTNSRCKQRRAIVASKMVREEPLLRMARIAASHTATKCTNSCGSKFCACDAAISLASGERSTKSVSFPQVRSTRKSRQRAAKNSSACSTGQPDSSNSAADSKPALASPFDTAVVTAATNPASGSPSTSWAMALEIFPLAAAIKRSNKLNASRILPLPSLATK